MYLLFKLHWVSKRRHSVIPLKSYLYHNCATNNITMRSWRHPVVSMWTTLSWSPTHLRGEPCLCLCDPFLQSWSDSVRARLWYTSVKMPKYVISDTQDETHQALDPDGTNAKVSFNNSEGSPAQKKSGISRGKCFVNEQLHSSELKNGYILLFTILYLPVCILWRLHSVTEWMSS